MTATLRESIKNTPAKFALAAILVGCAVRLAMYLQNPSLWFDEVAVALAAATRTRWDLSTLPPLYFRTESLFGALAGINEYALRLPSLIAGVLTLVVVFRLGVRVGGQYVGAFAAALAALSANLCRYSNELKPYGFDALMAALILLCTLPILLEDGGSVKQRIFLFSAGVAGIMFSTTAVFVLAGVGVAFVIARWKDSRLSQWWWFGAASALWVATFAVVYKLFYAASAGSEYMRQYWAGAAVSLSSGPLKIASTVAKAIAMPALGLEEGSILVAAVVAALMMPGIVAAYRRSGPAMVALLCVPSLVAVFAALAGKWYLVVRLVLFTVPEVCVLMALGAWEISQWLPKMFQLRGFAIVCVLTLILPAKYTFWNLRHTEHQSHREAATAALRLWQPGDVIYIYPRSTTPWAFYSIDWRSAGSRQEALGLMAAIERTGPNAGNLASRNKPVVHEGFDLRFVRAGRIELFGVPTGVQSNAWQRYGPPDTGWADNEIDRMMQEHSRRFWIYASDYHDQDMGSLLLRLREHGFSVEPVFRSAGLVLLRALRS